MSEDEENRLATELFGSDVQGVYDRFADALDKQGIPHRYYGFNNGGPATEKQKNYLRSLLRKHAGTETAEAIRNYLNCRRLIHEPIGFGTVSDSIQALKNIEES
ncbi:hypothetical protein [Streptomyces sp. NPDC051636]|uniref:hypothetical protein n=1 Tax=Streptomyces sp. NPDC051636 TaxID=3365663 RepID=UPI0037B9D001